MITQRLIAVMQTTVLSATSLPQGSHLFYDHRVNTEAVSCWQCVDERLKTDERGFCSCYGSNETCCCLYEQAIDSSPDSTHNNRPDIRESNRLILQTEPVLRNRAVSQVHLTCYQWITHRATVAPSCSPHVLRSLTIFTLLMTLTTRQSITIHLRAAHRNPRL